MEFALKPDEERFCQECTEYLRKQKTPELVAELEARSGYGGGPAYTNLIRRMARDGWLGVGWPKEYGGQARSVMELFILFDELAYAKAPAETMFFTEAVGGAILEGGSEELKRELLPKATAGEVTFWEGWSEPNAGSDLLSLTTRAVEDGDDYIVNGQKIWNGNAHLAGYGCAAVKTDPEAPRHKGISLLMIDMRTPGIEVRPIKDMTGGEPFCEVFFKDVRVPKKNLVGDVNQGVSFILSGLEWDRFWARCATASYYRCLLEEVIDYCQKTKANGKPLSDNPLIRHELAELAIGLEVCRVLFYRLLVMIRNEQPLTYEACAPKVYADELGQRFTNAVMQIMGLYGQRSEERRVGKECRFRWSPYH